MNASHTFLLGQQYSWDMPPDSSPKLSVVSTCPSFFIGGRKYKWDHSKPPNLVIKYWVPSHHHHRGRKDCICAILHQVVPTHQLGGKNYSWDSYLAPSPQIPVHLVGEKSYKWDFHLAPSWLLLTSEMMQASPSPVVAASPCPATASVPSINPSFNKPVSLLLPIPVVPSTAAHIVLFSHPHELLCKCM